MRRAQSVVTDYHVDELSLEQVELVLKYQVPILTDIVHQMFQALEKLMSDTRLNQDQMNLYIESKSTIAKIKYTMGARIMKEFANYKDHSDQEMYDSLKSIIAHKLKVQETMQDQMEFVQIWKLMLEACDVNGLGDGHLGLKVEPEYSCTVAAQEELVISETTDISIPCEVFHVIDAVEPDACNVNGQGDGIWGL